MNLTADHPVSNATSTGISPSNDNTTEKPPLIVDVITWFTIFAILATLVCNGLIFIVYCMRSQLRTPFNTYVANIAITEILLALTAMPGNFIRSFFGYWPYNAVACSFLMYTQHILGCGVRYGHALVTVNRIWAVTFPVNYKEKHTKRVARWIVLGTWIYLHVFVVPVILRGRIGMGTASVDRGCQNEVTGQYGGIMFMEIMGFNVPEIFIVLSFPYIIFKLRQRQKRSGNKVQPAGSTAPSVEIPRTVSRSHERVLLYLVIGVLICWTPNHIFYLLLETTGYWNVTFYAIQYFVQYSYSWINPILFYVALRPFRDAVNELLMCHWTRLGYNNSVAPDSTFVGRQHTKQTTEMRAIPDENSCHTSKDRTSSRAPLAAAAKLKY